MEYKINDILQAYNLFCAGIPAGVGGIVSMSQGGNCLVIKDGYL